MELGSKQLTILHFNDVYNIEERKTEPVGGVARFKTALDSFKELEPLILFSGDLFEPSLLSTAYDGEQMIVPVNAFNIDAACYGNHDFDLDLDVLCDYVEKCKFPWIISNVKIRSNLQTVASGKEYHIVNRKGLKIGIIGLAEREWVYETPSLELDEIIYEDFVKCARRLTTQLKETDKCDLVIALTHLRNPNDIKLGKEYTGLDLILGGHDHVNLIEKSNGTYIIKSGSDFAEFNKISLTLLDEHQIPNLPQGVKDEIYKDKYLVDIKTIDVTTQYEPNPELKKHVDDHLGNFEEKMKIPVLHTTVELETRFELVRASEQNFSNFLADVVRFDSGCDVCVINTGTLRSNCVFATGVLTLGDIRRILPWEDCIMKVRLTGQQLFEALDRSVAEFPTLNGSFFAVSGVTFAFDPKAESMKRVKLESVKIKGIPLDLNGHYKVATLLFLYHGKGGFNTIKEGESLNEEISAEEIHTILKRLFTLSKDPRIIEEWKKMHGSIDDKLEQLSLIKQPSLERRISEVKRMDFFYKLRPVIKDLTFYEGAYLITIAPTKENRIVIL